MERTTVKVDKSGKAVVEGDSFLAKLLKQSGKLKVNTPLKKGEYEIVEELPKKKAAKKPAKKTAKKKAAKKE